MSKKRELYDLLKKIGPIRCGTIHIIDNSGPNSTEPTFMVHIKGGVHFEIFVDVYGPYMDMIWRGHLPKAKTQAEEAEYVLGWLKLVGIKIGGSKVF